MPTSVTISVSSPNVGSERPALPSWIARNAPRLVCPISRPMGSAISALMATVTSVYVRCWSIRWGIEPRSSQAQFAPSKR
jgi:hypothetical protein